MRDLVFQPDYPLYKLLRSVPELVADDKYVVVRIPKKTGGAVIPLSGVVTAYRFVLVMVVGNPFTDKLLNTYEAKSERYEMGVDNEDCVLRLIRPDAEDPWVVFLRIVTYEGQQVAWSSRHSGMMYVAASGN